MRRRRLVLVAPWKLARAVVLLVVLVALVGFATHKWVDRGRDARAMATAPAAAQTLPETPASASATASASALATVASPAPTPTATATAGPTQAPAPRVDEQGFSHSDAVGDGTWTIADPVAPSQPGAATVYRYVLRVEGGTSVDAAAAAVVVENVLNDDRGWRGTEGVSFEQVDDPAAADFTLSIATPTTTDALCAPLETIGMWNCRNGTNVVLNSDRWTYGSPPSPASTPTTSTRSTTRSATSSGTSTSTAPAPASPRPSWRSRAAPAKAAARRTAGPPGTIRPPEAAGFPEAAGSGQRRVISAGFAGC